MTRGAGSVMPPRPAPWAPAAQLAGVIAIPVPGRRIPGRSRSAVIPWLASGDTAFAASRARHHRSETRPPYDPIREGSARAMSSMTVAHAMRPLSPVATLLRRIGRSSAAGLAQISRRLRGVAPERWLMVVLGLLLLAFLVALLLGPTVGRGGR